MDTLAKLEAASTDKEELSTFLQDNLSELYDYFLTQPFDELAHSKNRIETYLSRTLRILRSLNFSIESTRIFVILLLDVSERFGFLMSFQKLYNLLKIKECKVSSRLEAASLYIIGIRRITDYSDRIEPILNKLSQSYREEEDSVDKVIGTIVNYYGQVVNNFGSQNSTGVLQIRDALLSFSQKPDYFFLNHNLLEKILDFDVTENVSTYQKIHQLLDSFLKRTEKYSPFSRDEFLIEEGTMYSSIVDTADPNFPSIREISTKFYRRIADDRIFYSLQRGVSVLTDEKQLYAYMNSYGKMHHKKLTTALPFLPKEIFSKDMDVIDWGCGQGLATMVLIDYAKTVNATVKVKNVSLIEPSELALKRAALHVKKLGPDSRVRTINKDLDSLSSADFGTDKERITLHLFSNILDVDSFSLTKLIELINTTFTGEQYFVAVSPYISELKTNRLNGFLRYFSKYSNFKSLGEFNDKAGEWQSNWTRVVRVFQC